MDDQSSKPVDFFQMYFTDEVFELMVEQTKKGMIKAVSQLIFSKCTLLMKCSSSWLNKLKNGSKQ